LALIEAALVDPVDTASLVERKAVAKLQLDSVVYPVLTLPGEITSEIFLKCGGPEYLTGVPSARNAPLLLLRICRTWTKIALFTPALWTDLSIGYDGPRKDVTIAAVAQGIHRWFGRSSTLPISLYFWGDSEKWYTYTKTLLHRQASRLDTLSLVQDFDASALGERGYFAILQSLTLERTSSIALITTFHDSPRLREVNLSRISPRNVALPYHQLTRFSASGLSIVDCLGVLRDCPFLKQLSLEAIQAAEHLPVYPTPVHQALEELSIESSSAGTLHFLDLPALRALTLTGANIWGAFFNDFLRRSSNSLRALTYIENVPSCFISLEWFRTANRLVEVTLTTSEADFIQTLLLELDRSVHPKSLPDLHHLEIASTCHCTIDAPIIAALQSRRPPVIASLEGESDAAAAKSNAPTTAYTIEYEVETATLESLCLIRLCSNYDPDWEEIGEIRWEEMGDIDWDALYMLG
ncbi:hypothetical protein B0H16DRAFT_1551053, partial [Mycena metata]